MTAFTAEQIAVILNHSESVVLIVSKRFASKAPGDGQIKILPIEDLQALTALAAIENTPSSLRLPSGISSQGLDGAVSRFSSPVLESLVYGDEKGLTALVHLKPETIEQIASRIKDDIENAEHHIARILEDIRTEANARLAGFSRLANIEHQKEPFEKTPSRASNVSCIQRNRGRR